MISDKGTVTSAKNINDGDIETYYNSATALCYIGLDFGATSKAEIHLVRFFLRMGSDHEDFIGSNIEVSDDGITWTVINTQKQILADGWNFW